MTNWKETTFCDLLPDGTRNGIYKKKEFHGTGVKIVNMGELFAHPRMYSVPMKRVELTQSEKDRFLLEQGDLLFARRSLVAEGAGKCSIIMDVDEPTTFESSIIRGRPDPKKADSLFLYYLFNSPYGTYLLSTIRRQVAVAGITGSDLVNLKFNIPPLSEQKRIAGILGSLDDKIELNREINQTLEAMARAIFQSWFVDFDPVLDNTAAAGNPIPAELKEKCARRKKQKSKHPLSKEIKNLFPDSFIDSPLGPIPKGWKVKSLFDTATFVNGSSFQSTYFCEPSEGLPIIKITELKNGISNQTSHTTQILDDKYSVDTGDMFYSWSGSPDTSLDVFLWTGGPGWLNQHIFKVITTDEAEKVFEYFLLRHLRDTLVEIARDKQTTGLGHVTISDMKRLRVLYPNGPLLEYYHKTNGPIFNQIFTNLLENKTLTHLRDTLLPKLLTGEIEV